MHHQCALSECLRVASAGGAESIILSAGGTENTTLSGGAKSMMLSACAESMIVLAPPAASMIHSQPHLIALLHYLLEYNITLTAARWGATKKATITNTDDFPLTTLVNSASTALPIGLPLKMAKFCHTSNRFLVGH
jgi:hypothetical protein